jgi:hypothetical protein
VLFPSGAELTGLGPEARCLTVSRTSAAMCGA